jgi:hypothetical protein
MGFDELNIIEPDDDWVAVWRWSGGGGGASDWDWDLPVYDFLDGLVGSAVDEWMKKLQPAIDWIKDHLEEILAVATAIGAEFLMWQLAKKLMPNLGSALAHMKKIMSILTALATAAITVVLVYTFDNKYLETGKFGYLIADAIATGLGSAIMRCHCTSFNGGGQVVCMLPLWSLSARVFRWGLPSRIFTTTVLPRTMSSS